MGKLLDNKRIRREILRFINVLHEEGYHTSSLEQVLWRVFSGDRVTVYVDDSLSVSTSPQMPIEVVFTAEL